MLRNLRKRIQAKRLGTPVKTGEGTYLVPAAAYVRTDGDVHYQIDTKDIALVIIAEEMGTDEPQVVLREYARRRFIAAVRRASATPAETKEQKNNLDQLLIPSAFNREGTIIPFPADKVSSEMCSNALTTVDAKSEALGFANPRLANQTFVVDKDGSQNTGEQKAVEEEPVEQKPIPQTSTDKQPTEQELIQAAIEEVLASANTDEERMLFREFLKQHPDLARGAIDDRVRLRLFVDTSRKVRSHYTRYSHPVAREA